MNAELIISTLSSEKKRNRGGSNYLIRLLLISFILSPSHPHKAAELVIESVRLNPRVLGSIIALSPSVVLMEEAAAAEENDPVSFFLKGTRGWDIWEMRSKDESLRSARCHLSGWGS